MSDPISPLTEIGDYLQSLGFGVQNTDLFLGILPDGPDELIVLTQYYGNAPEYIQERMLPNAESLQLQVVIRSRRYEVAEAKAYRVWRALASVTNQTLGGTKYRSIKPNGSPALLSYDASERVRIFFNATVEKEVPLVA